MVSKAAINAFNELGYGTTERLHGMPKLEYLAHYAPEILSAVVDQCKSEDGAAAEIWRRFFATYPPRRIVGDERDEAHLEMYRMYLNMLPIAIRLDKELTGGTMKIIEAIIGSSWQYMENVGGDWDIGKAHMIVSSFAYSFHRTPAETTEMVKYIAKHLPEAERMIPELTNKDISGIAQLRNMIEPDDGNGDDIDGAE